MSFFDIKKAVLKCQYVVYYFANIIIEMERKFTTNVKLN